MEQAIGAYRGTAADEEFRYLEWLREKRRHDEAQALYNTVLESVGYVKMQLITVTAGTPQVAITPPAVPQHKN
ncbi:MAG: hypothetical protein FWG65_01955 [Turicibacter sp.]|nr:hypothetical protein [Turicibacter sp.]